MMDYLEKVYEITIELKELLDQNITTKNREEVINKLNQLIETRGKWMDQLQPPYTEAEKELGEKIYALNTGIQNKMQQLFTDLKLEMRQVQKQKKTNVSYTNPYRNVHISDGTFMDSKN
ncbi:hypothetical protein JYK21_10395 [Ralstonia pickettii]|nr:hypothetical protein [Ralstonia pickettii]